MKPLVGSYSLLNTFGICPLQAQHKYVLRDLPKETSPALERGNYVHKAMEKRCGFGDPLPDDLKEYEPFAAKLGDGAGGNCTELELAVTRDWQPTNFWAPNAWFRGKIDLLSFRNDVALIVDWKTGKVREDPFELVVFATLLDKQTIYHAESRKAIRGMYIWLNDMKPGQVHNLLPYVKGCQRIIERVMERIETLKRCEAEPWPATPNGLCAFCPVKDCKHNRKPK